MFENNSLKVKFRNLLMFIYILLTVRLLIASQEINSPEFLSLEFYVVHHSSRYLNFTII